MSYIILEKSNIPNNLQEIFSNIKSVLKVDTKNIFKTATKRKKNTTIIKTSKLDVIETSNFFNVKPKITSNHLNFEVFINNYYIKFIETRNLNISNKISLQEIGVILNLDCKNKVLGKDLITETKKFLNENEEWKKSCYETANAINEKFNVYDYEVHHQSDFVKTLRQKGKMLSKLSPDKWNPSDIFLVKNSKNVMNDLNDISDILTLNKYISKSNNIIGISLKKSENEALHGSVALEKVNKDLNLGSSFTVIKNLDDVKQRLRIDLMKLQKTKISNLLFITKSQSKNLSNEIQQMIPESENFFKSFPLGIEFLSRICNSNFEEIIKHAYLLASSSDKLSCPYYKASSDGIKQIQYNEIDFKLERILIPINGETNVIFMIKVNDKKIKLQLRSKGTRPLFNIIYTEPKKDLGINIKNFYF